MRSDRGPGGNDYVNRSPSPGSAPVVRTFLIVDVRGYTRFTHAHGDEAARDLAARFALPGAWSQTHRQRVPALLDALSSPPYSQRPPRLRSPKAWRRTRARLRSFGVPARDPCSRIGPAQRSELPEPPDP